MLQCSPCFFSFFLQVPHRVTSSVCRGSAFSETSQSWVCVWVSHKNIVWAVTERLFYTLGGETGHMSLIELLSHHSIGQRNPSTPTPSNRCLTQSLFCSFPLTSCQAILNSFPFICLVKEKNVTCLVYITGQLGDFCVFSVSLTSPL